MLRESKEPALGAGGLEFKSPRPDHSLPSLDEVTHRASLAQKSPPPAHVASLVRKPRIFRQELPWTHPRTGRLRARPLIICSSTQHLLSINLVRARAQ